MTVQSAIEELLRKEIGLNPGSIGSPAIAGAVRARMQALNAASESEYWRVLQETAGEVQALIEKVVVPETWFFRDAAPFDLLRRLARTWSRERAGGVLRILSVPCATGEEPYSMAMALLDEGLAPERFRIDAIDVSDVSLAHAARGLYGRHSFRTADLSFRDRYFRAVENGWVLSEAVRETIHFRRRNLLENELPVPAGTYDFIFCRNLLIYFDEPARRRAVGTLKRALASHGQLFVGHAELPVVTPHGFAGTGEPGAFACVHAEAKPVETVTPAPRRALAPVRKPVPRPVSRPVVKSPAISVAPTAAKSLLPEAERLANGGRLGEAAALCRTHLAEHGDSALAHYLLGLTADAGGDDARAAGHYRKALYLEPDHYEALVHLSMLLEKQGDAAGAERLDRRARRAKTESGKAYA